MKRQDGFVRPKSGSWLGHYSQWIIDPATGQKKRRQRAFRIGPVKGMTKTQAKNKLRERLVRELGVTSDSRMTLAAFIETRWKPMRVGTWRDSTKAVNKELLKFVIDRFGSTPLEDLDAVQLQIWLNDLAERKSDSLVKHCRIFLCSILGEATEQEYIRKNPARLLRLPITKEVKKPYLEIEQATALLEAAKWFPRERTLLSVILVTGFRPSELFALKWDCFDSATRTIVIHQTIYRGKIRPFTKTTEQGDRDHITVYLPDAARFALLKWFGESEHNRPEDYIFPNSKGGPFIKENYQKRILTPLAKMAGIPRVNFQILRRTVATHAQHLGSPKDISVILRHKKVQTAQEYYVQKMEATVKETSERLADTLIKQPNPNPAQAKEKDYFDVDAQE